LILFNEMKNRRIKMKGNTFNPTICMGELSDIQRFQKKYADLFKPQETVLDIGCGRGIFLELLRERQVEGIGIDDSPDVIKDCKSRGLHAVQSDALLFLRNKNKTYDGLMLSHIIEHLQPSAFIELLELACKRLNPNGRIIIITPNFRELEVVTETFWLDITHIRPYPLPLLVKLIEYVGFEIDSMGSDPDTGPRKPPFYRFHLYCWYLIRKIRYGKYFGNGDTFVVARKRS
jgi:2-polyprenyl-3-methyl-5-hydroxy-6-metoxy-1,4-benzoquinol methylase